MIPTSFYLEAWLWSHAPLLGQLLICFLVLGDMRHGGQVSSFGHAKGNWDLPESKMGELSAVHSHEDPESNPGPDQLSRALLEPTSLI